MAFAFSKCAPSQRSEPSLHFIRAAVRGRRGPLLQHPHPGLCGAPAPLRRPPCSHLHPHPRSPAGAQGLETRRRRLPVPGRGAGQDSPWLRLFSELQRAGGASGPLREAGRPVRALIFAPSAAQPLLAPQSLGKQRPGAILGRGTLPKPSGGHSPALSQTPAIRTASLAHPSSGF